MNAAIQRLRSKFATATLLCLLLMSAVIAHAQSVPTPIVMGENQLGSITNSDGNIPYSLSVAAPQSVEIQVLAVTSGFAPGFRVLDPSGVVVLEATNPAGQTIAQGISNLSSPGTYTVEVFSANHTAGQFLISVQAGAPLTPPQPLTVGQVVTGTLDSETTRQAYTFGASASEVLLLTVRGDDPMGGALIALRDAETGDTFGLSNAQVGGVRYRIYTGQRAYLLEISHPGGDERKPFTVCLEAENGSVTCGEPPPSNAPIDTSVDAATSIPVVIASPTPDVGGTCAVTSAGQAINVRSGPSTGYGIIGSLAVGTSAPVVGRLADNSWFQINWNGLIGWVSATVVTLSGNCGGVGVVAPPPPPPQQPTQPNPTQPPAPTQPNSNNPTATPTNNGAPTPTPPPQGTPEPPHVEVTFVMPDIDLIVSVFGITTLDSGVKALNVAVINNGSARNIGAFNVAICIHDIPDVNAVLSDYCTYQRVDLGGNDSTNIVFDVPVIISGVHNVTAAVDSSNEISETDESNNGETDVGTF